MAKIVEETARKREAIANKIQVSEDPQDLEEGLAQLNAYLERYGKKQTTERRLILRKLHQLTQPVDIRTLSSLIEEDKVHISQATLYNTLQLFCEAQLVSRIDLIEGGMSFFVRTVGIPPRVYVVCKRCGTITTSAQPGLMDQLTCTCPKGFKVAQYSFNVFGLCHRCQNTMNRAEQRRRAKSAAAKSVTVKSTATKPQRINNNKKDKIK